MEVLGDFCAECNSCKQICPKSAISMVIDDEGFSRPMIANELCINCGLCLKVCPMKNSESLKYKEGKVFAVQARNKDLLSQSSSGGMFSLISKFILSESGIVYGAAWDNNLNLHHIGVESISELSKLRGSKYVHSDINNCFVDIRKHLNNGRLVYFTGTPCQVAGLRLFLRKDFKNLLTSDLVCHGTPSQKIFKLFVSQIEKDRKSKLINYSFRDKRVAGWSCNSPSSLYIDLKSGKCKYSYFDKNMMAYSKAFIKGDLTRMDCYSCPFANPQRVGDITLADYWDVRKQHPEFPNIKAGVSLVIVNTDRGCEVFDKIKGDTVWINSTMENAKKTSNRNLVHPTVKPVGREKNYKLAFSDFIAFRDSYLKDEPSEFTIRKMYLKNKIKNVKLVDSLLKKIIRYEKG